MRGGSDGGGVLLNVVFRVNSTTTFYTSFSSWLAHEVWMIITHFWFLSFTFTFHLFFFFQSEFNSVSPFRWKLKLLFQSNPTKLSLISLSRPINLPLSMKGMRMIMASVSHFLHLHFLTFSPVMSIPLILRPDGFPSFLPFPQFHIVLRVAWRNCPRWGYVSSSQKKKKKRKKWPKVMRSMIDIFIDTFWNAYSNSFTYSYCATRFPFSATEARSKPWTSLQRERTTTVLDARTGCEAKVTHRIKGKHNFRLTSFS